ncbi:coiled-coil domain-containing protein 106-like [Dicentrarchus labrax]|uniref:coiled-coil domain-containing protein 106-like n=1 Tax=Dicentrarchus labrax TaxID=13489 RepID=UPI0021F67FCB|nr:coiled-coil domain-containing protein 106-like [Dicentrarchus labrax]
MPLTRGKRQTKSKQTSNPPDDDMLQSGNEVEEIAQPSAPTTAPTMAKFKEDYRLLKEENRLLKEENRLLKEERDFLRQKGLNPVKTRPSTSSKGSDKRRRMDSSDSSTSDSESDSSSEEEKRNKKKRKNKKKENPAKFGKRVQGPEDVVHRYRAVLKEFRCTRSISLSCETLSVDRNTIALMAIIAEVWIAAEGEDFGLLPEFTEEDTLGNYAKTCKTFLEGNNPLEEKI